MPPDAFLEIPRNHFLDYLTRQIDSFFPDGSTDTRDQLARVFDEAVDRFRFCASNAVYWRDNRFHPLHSDKNAAFLSYLANTVHSSGGERLLCDKLFYLNKALNGFHCLYNAELPDIFYIAHSVGIVLGRLKYPRFLVICQGATIGWDNGAEPVIEEGVILYPGSSIIGRCHIRARTVVSQNTSIINQDTPGDCVAFNGGKNLEFKKAKRDIFSDYFLRSHDIGRS